MNDCDYTSLAREFLGGYIQQLNFHSHQLEQSADTEHLHQLRVHLRRLRNGLRIFSDLFDVPRVRAWQGTLRQFSKITSLARDLDVQIEFLNTCQRYSKNKIVLEGINSLSAEFIALRRRLQPEILKSLAKLKAERTLENIQNCLARTPKERRCPLQHVHEVAFKKIHNQVFKLLAYEIFVNRPGRIAELHQMRIANKHLRYTLEGLAGIYSAEFKVFIKTIVFIHRTLGSMHDCDVWLQFLTQKLKTAANDQRVQRAACNALKIYCQMQRNLYYNKFQKSWRQVREKRFFEDLLGYVRSQD